MTVESYRSPRALRMPQKTAPRCNGSMPPVRASSATSPRGPVRAYIPFCGLPPVPDELWQRWITDPVLLGTLGALLGAALHISRRRQRSAGQRGSLLAGWSVLTLALASPLCALSVALFSARASQHMLLLVIAAPLLAVGLSPSLAAGRRPRAPRWMRQPGPACLPALLFAALLWGWHVPTLYDATFRSDLAYWLMHLTLLGAAIPLWMQLLQAGTGQLLLRALLGFATFVQMGILGALLTLSPVVLYGAHVTTTLAWGMQPLADQQLGGLIMWVPGCGAVLLALLVGLNRGLRHAAARSLADGAPALPR
jgi:putative membrane protein